jgi:hypothetical protein
VDEKPRLMPVDVLGGMLLRFEILSAERPISPNAPLGSAPPAVQTSLPLPKMAPFRALTMFCLCAGSAKLADWSKALSLMKPRDVPMHVASPLKGWRRYYVLQVSVAQPSVLRESLDFW